MTIGLKRWGNSYGLRIPKSLALRAGVAEGQEFDVQIEDGRIVLEPATPKLRTLDIEDLLVGVTPEMMALDDDAGWGAPVGREIW